MNLQRFKENYLRLSRNFKKPIDDGARADLLDYLSLKKWTDAEFEAAVNACLEDCKFFPNLHELRKARPQPSRVWEAPKPEQTSYSAREDQEINDLLENIDNQGLRETCRRILFRLPKPKTPPEVEFVPPF